MVWLTALQQSALAVHSLNDMQIPLLRHLSYCRRSSTLHRTSLADCNTWNLSTELREKTSALTDLLVDLSDIMNTWEITNSNYLCIQTESIVSLNFVRASQISVWQHVLQIFTIAPILFLYCIVLYLYIYMALLTVHTNQKCFQCERPREKRAVLREWKEALGNVAYIRLFTTKAEKIHKKKLGT